MKDKKLTVAALSDTHQWHDIHVPLADILVHAGDACLQGTLSELDRFAEWWNALPHKHKIFVPGNHDWTFQRREATSRLVLAGTHVLIDEEVEIEGRKIWGSPYTPLFCNWAFNVPKGLLFEHWNKIPQNLDLLITHGPPQGILDQARPLRSKNLGDSELRYAVDKKTPLRHVFGHIHGSYGMTKVGPTCFHNLSVVDESYRRVHEVQEFSI